MDQRIRIAVAASILLGGTLLAFCFRRDASSGQRQPRASDPLVLRKPSLAEPAAGTGVAVPPGPTPTVRGHFPASGVQPGTAPVILAPQSRGSAPPELMQSYSPPEMQSSRWGVSMGLGLPPSQTARPKTHKIVDGDTLEGIAERYLGSPERAAEILEANRDKLFHPRLLPIGVELRLPTGEPSTQPPPSQLPLVPIAGNAAR